MLLWNISILWKEKSNKSILILKLIKYFGLRTVAQHLWQLLPWHLVSEFSWGNFVGLETWFSIKKLLLTYWCDVTWLPSLAAWAVAERVGPISSYTDLLPGKQEKESDREQADCPLLPLTPKQKIKKINSLCHLFLIVYQLKWTWSCPFCPYL